jgi:Flp pilus assembly protein TadG
MQRRPHGSERGSAVTETVILMPVLLFLVTLVIQFGLWYHAEHVVQAAADEGVRAARLQGGTAQAGQQRAQDFLTHAGRSIVVGPVVTASRDLNVASVTVTGTAVAVLPGLHLRLRSTATGEVERFRAGP